MGRLLKVRKLTAAEVRQAGLWAEEAESAWQRRRAAIMAYHAAGLAVQDIAAALQIHPHTVYAVLHAFDRQGLEALRAPGRRGVRSGIGPDQAARICRLADGSPGDVGEPWGRWSLTTLRSYLLRERWVRRISREHLRRLLKKGIRLRRLRRKLLSTDPRRNAILARIRWVWRHLGRRDTMVFFDTKPVAVKAYGGRRYTSAKQLVLPLRQKTRGRFQFFGLYDPQSGRVRLDVPAGEGLRGDLLVHALGARWYPRGQVWVVLDQDTAHPKKSRQTRRTMRQLGLHWISLPKASPDDNPVETLNSDIQRMVLDCSNDSDVRTTQRRISARLRGRNRRHDRWIKIHYLPDSAKK